MTQPTNLRPVTQLTDLELAKLLDRKLADLDGFPRLEEKLGTQKYQASLNAELEKIRQIEAEQRYRSEREIQKSMLKVYKTLVCERTLNVARVSGTASYAPRVDRRARSAHNIKRIFS
jgi:hypothetical protein